MAGAAWWAALYQDPACRASGVAMKHIPPIPLLLAFEAVARLGSFHRAAEELALAHSTISHRIRELEQLCGMVLFTRTTRSVTPTPDAERLLVPVRNALATLGGAFAPVGDANVVRVSLLPSFARFRLLPALADFQRSHPQLCIEIDPTSRLVVPRQGDADIALRFTRAPPAEPHLDLGHDDWFPVAAPHYLASLRHRAMPALLGEAGMLAHTRHGWDRWCREAGVPVPRSSRVTAFTDTGLMLDAAMQGQGIACGRRSLLVHPLRAGQLVRLSPIAVASEHRYFLMASPRYDASPQVRLVHEWVRRLVTEE